MGQQAQIIKKVELSGTKSGVISISNIPEPYGTGSENVASIGISLSGKEEPDWKVHIPYDKIDVVCEALQEAKEKYGK